MEREKTSKFRAQNEDIAITEQTKIGTNWKRKSKVKNKQHGKRERKQHSKWNRNHLNDFA